MECSWSATLGDPEATRPITTARIYVCIFIMASFVLLNHIRRHREVDGSDYAEEQEVKPHYESNVDDDANMEKNIEQFTVGRFVFVHEFVS
jgi:hypothetical protein